MDILATEGDVELVDGDLAWVDGPDAVVQDIEMSLKTWLEESADDRSVGIPYLQIIFKRGTTKAAIQFIIESHLRARPGVSDVLELNTSLDSTTRELSITGSVKLTDQQTVVFGPVEVSQ